MCTTCGCGHGNVRLDGQAPHSPVADQAQRGSLVRFTPASQDVPERSRPSPGATNARIVQMEQDILGKNNAYADKNRAQLARQQVIALNLVSSPGSGKTAVLVETLRQIQARCTGGVAWQLAVIEGDQETANDAERIRETGVPAVQINTGKGCHLDAHMVGHALAKFDLAALDAVFIENVGNLVCPAAFDLGEDAKVAILSVTEGEDKPLKYPDMFHASRLMLLNKVDLLPYLDFDVEACVANARRVNPDIEVIEISAKSGAGMDAWLAWLERLRRQKLQLELAQLQQTTEAIQSRLSRALDGRV